MGPGSVEPPAVDELVPVTSAADMFEAVVARFDGCDVFIAAAAVCDYRPVVRETHKIKKTEARVMVELERTADIVAQMSKRRRRQTVVGFCLETDNLEQQAREKLQVKQLDFVVANGPEAIDADRQDALLLTTDGRAERFTDLPKEELARRLLAVVAKRGR
jgi:phosphopantothenoylcysteine decarboxylase/phosphopantothenate--cysteine ligase